MSVETSSAPSVGFLWTAQAVMARLIAVTFLCSKGVGPSFPVFFLYLTSLSTCLSDESGSFQGFQR